MSHWPDPKLMQGLTVPLPPHRPSVTVDWSQVKAWPEYHSPADTELNRLRKEYAKPKTLTEQSMEHTQGLYISPIVRAKRAINRYLGAKEAQTYVNLEQYILEEIQAAVAMAQRPAVEVRALEAQLAHVTRELAIAQQSLAGAKQVIRTYASESAYNPPQSGLLAWALSDAGHTARQWLSRLKRKTTCA
jgi:hypothetical protein